LFEPLVANHSPNSGATGVAPDQSLVALGLLLLRPLVELGSPGPVDVELKRPQIDPKLGSFSELRHLKAWGQFAADQVSLSILLLPSTWGPTSTKRLPTVQG
jgi:uncharacterized heparinase superfamily protein